MTRDDIIRTARDSGLVGLEQGGILENFQRFAALVAAAEREACAKICDETRYTGDVPAEDGEARQYYDAAAEDCAEQIRARGDT